MMVARSRLLVRNNPARSRRLASRKVPQERRTPDIDARPDCPAPGSLLPTHLPRGAVERCPRTLLCHTTSAVAWPWIGPKLVGTPKVMLLAASCRNVGARLELRATSGIVRRIKTREFTPPMPSGPYRQYAGNSCKSSSTPCCTARYTRTLNVHVSVRHALRAAAVRLGSPLPTPATAPSPVAPLSQRLQRLLPLKVRSTMQTYGVNFIGIYLLLYYSIWGIGCALARRGR